MGVGAGFLNIGTVHLKGGLILGAEVRQLRYATLHPESHFVLGYTCLGLRITEAIKGFTVQFSKSVKHGPAVPWVDTWGVLDVEDGITGAAESHAIILGGQKTATPHAGEESLCLAGLGKSRSENDEGGGKRTWSLICSRRVVPSTPSVSTSWNLMTCSRVIEYSMSRFKVKRCSRLST
jgi:hypothetical protein